MLIDHRNSEAYKLAAIYSLARLVYYITTAMQGCTVNIQAAMKLTERKESRPKVAQVKRNAIVLRSSRAFFLKVGVRAGLFCRDSNSRVVHQHQLKKIKASLVEILAKRFVVVPLPLRKG